MESLSFSKYKIILFKDMDNSTSFLPVCMPFISFSCLFALARTSSTLLNNSGQSGHPRSGSVITAYWEAQMGGSPEVKSSRPT